MYSYKSIRATKEQTVGPFVNKLKTYAKILEYILFNLDIFLNCHFTVTLYLFSPLSILHSTLIWGKVQDRHTTNLRYEMYKAFYDLTHHCFPQPIFSENGNLRKFNMTLEQLDIYSPTYLKQLYIQGKALNCFLTIPAC